LVYSRKAKISAWNFRKKTVKNNVVSGSSRPGDHMLWELRGERVKDVLLTRSSSVKNMKEILIGNL